MPEPCGGFRILTKSYKHRLVIESKHDELCYSLGQIILACPGRESVASHLGKSRSSDYPRQVYPSWPALDGDVVKVCLAPDRSPMFCQRQDLRVDLRGWSTFELFVPPCASSKTEWVPMRN